MSWSVDVVNDVRPYWDAGKGRYEARPPAPASSSSSSSAPAPAPPPSAFASMVVVHVTTAGGAKVSVSVPGGGVATAGAGDQGTLAYALTAAVNGGADGTVQRATATPLQFTVTQVAAGFAPRPLLDAAGRPVFLVSAAADAGRRVVVLTVAMFQPATATQMDPFDLASVQAAMPQLLLGPAGATAAAPAGPTAALHAALPLELMMAPAAVAAAPAPAATPPAGALAAGVPFQLLTLNPHLAAAGVTLPPGMTTIDGWGAHVPGNNGPVLQYYPDSQVCPVGTQFGGLNPIVDSLGCRRSSAGGQNQFIKFPAAKAGLQDYDEYDEVGMSFMLPGRFGVAGGAKDPGATAPSPGDAAGTFALVPAALGGGLQLFSFGAGGCVVPDTTSGPFAWALPDIRAPNPVRSSAAGMTAGRTLPLRVAPVDYTATPVPPVGRWGVVPAPVALPTATGTQVNLLFQDAASGTVYVLCPGGGAFGGVCVPSPIWETWGSIGWAPAFLVEAPGWTAPAPQRQFLPDGPPVGASLPDLLVPSFPTVTGNAAHPGALGACVLTAGWPQFTFQLRGVPPQAGSAGAFCLARTVAPVGTTGPPGPAAVFDAPLGGAVCPGSLGTPNSQPPPSQALLAAAGAHLATVCGAQFAADAAGGVRCQGLLGATGATAACSGFRTENFAASCAAACALAPRACDDAKAAYCTAFPASTDCACIAADTSPFASPVNPVNGVPATFAQYLESYRAAYPGADQSVLPQCWWAPCGPGGALVTSALTAQCPQAFTQCIAGLQGGTASNATVTVDLVNQCVLQYKQQGGGGQGQAMFPASAVWPPPPTQRNQLPVPDDYRGPTTAPGGGGGPKPPPPPPAAIAGLVLLVLALLAGLAWLKFKA